MNLDDFWRGRTVFLAFNMRGMMMKRLSFGVQREMRDGIDDVQGIRFCAGWRIRARRAESSSSCFWWIAWGRGGGTRIDISFFVDVVVRMYRIELHAAHVV